MCMRRGTRGENQFCVSVGACGVWFMSSHVRVSEEEEWSELKSEPGRKNKSGRGSGKGCGLGNI